MNLPEKGGNGKATSPAKKEPIPLPNQGSSEQAVIGAAHSEGMRRRTEVTGTGIRTPGGTRYAGATAARLPPRKRVCPHARYKAPFGLGYEADFAQEIPFPFFEPRRQGMRQPASDFSISHPLRMVSSGAAKEMRKQTPRSENTLPGMISTLFSMAFLTKASPSPPGACGKI